MICLDANYLIGGVSPERPESRHLVAWALAGESFCTAAPAWYEFLCGPLEPEQIDAMATFLQGRIRTFDESLASSAAQLFNQIGRPHRLRLDVMIAASAMQMEVPLATLNLADYERLVPWGLKIASPP